MKRLLLSLTLIASSAAMAQANGPVDVCRRISAWNSTNGASCAQVISRSRFDQAVIDVAYGLANTGNTSASLSVMQTGANRRMDANTTRVCTRVASWNATNAIACVANALDASFDESALNVAYNLANSGNTSAAVEALKNARDAYIVPSAARVCERVASWNATNGAACVAIIANKDFMNGTESICYDLANSGNTSSANQCLLNAGIQYNPYPPMPTQITMDSMQFSDIQRGLKKAERMLDRGMIEEARRSIMDLNRTIDEVAAQNGAGRIGGGRGR
ncbi:MAG: hypothetical protein K2P81_12000 [Bacteriovoracaceae bacterium]|nr:hypothetical protein [Bacteriovoracaceae bacterium]